VYPKFSSVNMIFSAVQTLEYNKIGMGFNHRGGARGPLSAPRLLVSRLLKDNISNIAKVDVNVHVQFNNCTQ